MAAIYRAHPRFKDAAFEYWYPELGEDEKLQVEDFGQASLEGGDVEIIGKGTSHRHVRKRPWTDDRAHRQFFAKGAAWTGHRRVMTKDRAHMHLDTVFTLLDRDKATAFPKVVEGIRSISLRPGRKPGTLDVRPTRTSSRPSRTRSACKLHVVETGGDAYQQAREQWDDGNNVVALEPGVVVAYERNTFTISKMREAGVEVVTIEGFELGKVEAGALHDLPGRARPHLGGVCNGLRCRRPRSSRS